MITKLLVENGAIINDKDIEIMNDYIVNDIVDDKIKSFLEENYGIQKISYLLK